MRAEVLERLIERSLIRQLARRAEIDASDTELEGAIQAIARENELSLEQLRGNVEAQGLPFAAYRERIRDEIVHQKVISGMVQPRVHLEEEEIRALYRERYADQRQSGEEVHLRHLMVPRGEKSPTDVDAACASARARILAGEPFETVAAEGSGPLGGGDSDLGWLHADELASWMRPVVAGLDPGATSEVVETPFGCNLLQLVARRAMRPVSYEEARPSLRDELYEQRFTEEYTQFVEKLRRQTYVERKGIFAEAARLGAPTPGATALEESPAP